MNIRKSVRDQQRSKVYKSDEALQKIAAPLPAVEDVQRFVRKMWKSGRVKTAFPNTTRKYLPKVKDGRGTRIAHAVSSGLYKDKAGKANYGHINIPLWARNEAVVLHELAHIVTDHENGRNGIAAHGWQFCATYLKLTLYMMGREAHDALKAAFKANRVRFTKPKPRKALSPERRAQMIEVLTRARAARDANKEQ